VTDHEIDELAKREWTHEELLELGVLPMTQREVAAYFREIDFPGGKDQAAIGQSVEKSIKKLRNSEHLDELSDAIRDFRQMCHPVCIRRDRKRRRGRSTN